MEHELRSLPDIKSRNPYGQSEKLLDGRPEEQVKVLGLLWARDNTDGDDVFMVEADFGREVVVVEDQWPSSLLTVSPRGKTICQQP